MYKILFLTFFLSFSSFITIYPSKNENTNLVDYCYSLEKIISRNSIEKSKKLSKKYKSLAKDITLFGTNNTKGAAVNKLIDQYKTIKKAFIISFIPNKFYCFAGYYIERLNPGKFQSILYEKSKQKINQYNNLKKEVDELIKDINSEYKYFKEEIDDLF